MTEVLAQILKGASHFHSRILTAYATHTHRQQRDACRSGAAQTRGCAEVVGAQLIRVRPGGDAVCV